MKDTVHHRREQGQLCLTRAAAMAIDGDPTSKAGAILLAAIGIVHLAASDPDLKAMDIVQRVLAKADK